MRIFMMAGVFLSACGVGGNEGGMDVSVQIVEPTDGESICLPCRVSVRVRGLDDAAEGRVLSLHVNGQDFTLADADMLLSKVGEEVWNEGDLDGPAIEFSGTIDVDKPGIYDLSATLRATAESDGDASVVEDIRSRSVHIFLLPAILAGTEITGANIDETRIFEHVVFDFNHVCAGIAHPQRAIESGPGRQGEQLLWAPVRHCLGAFVERYPNNTMARWLMGRVREGDGDWNEALGHYEAVSNRITAPGLLYPRMAAVRELAAAEEKERELRAGCMWCSNEVVSSQVTDDEADVNLYLRCILPVSTRTVVPLPTKSAHHSWLPWRLLLLCSCAGAAAAAAAALARGGEGGGDGNWRVVEKRR